MAKRKGFTWTHKKAWIICKDDKVFVESLKGKDCQVLLYLDKRIAEEEATKAETVRPCEIIVKVKEDCSCDL